MMELIIVKQGQEIIGNREITGLETLERETVFKELKDRYPEDAYTFYAHRCYDNKPCEEVPVKIKDLAKAAKKEPAKTEGEGAGTGDKAKANVNAKTAKEKGKAGKK
jgi:hypothetical protein